MCHIYCVSIHTTPFLEKLISIMYRYYSRSLEKSELNKDPALVESTFLQWETINLKDRWIRQHPLKVGFQGGSLVISLSMQERRVGALNWEDPLKKEMAWTEAPGRQQSMGSRRVRHNQAHPHTQTWWCYRERTEQVAASGVCRWGVGGNLSEWLGWYVLRALKGDVEDG